MTRPLESFLRDLASVRDTFLRVTGAWFDADVHGLPPLKMSEKQRTEKGKKQVERRKIHTIQGQRFAEGVDEDGGLFWENITGRTAKESSRSHDLTDYDHAELTNAGLDTDKAEMLKPMWADGLTNPQIVNAINGDADRYGLGLRTIESYTSAFSRALAAELLED
jgi:hypothetical protein